MPVVIFYLFLLLAYSSLVLHFFLLLLPAAFLDLPIQFCLHFPAFALELLLLVVVELLGEESAIVAALLELLHFLFIKHIKIL
jgi:hypothetical protein